MGAGLHECVVHSEPSSDVRTLLTPLSWREFGFDVCMWWSRTRDALMPLDVILLRYHPIGIAIAFCDSSTTIFPSRNATLAVDPRSSLDTASSSKYENGTPHAWTHTHTHCHTHTLSHTHTHAYIHTHRGKTALGAHGHCVYPRARVSRFRLACDVLHRWPSSREQTLALDKNRRSDCGKLVAEL
jgi:hypothetical protein